MSNVKSCQMHSLLSKVNVSIKSYSERYCSTGIWFKFVNFVYYCEQTYSLAIGTKLVYIMSCMTEQIMIENDSAVFNFGKFWAMEECHIVQNGNSPNNAKSWIDIAIFNHNLLGFTCLK